MEPWRQFERDVAALLHLRTTVASGSQFNDPGDGVSDGHHSEVAFPIMVDCKCTENKGFTLTHSDLNGGRVVAARFGKFFALPIRFYKRSHPDWVVMPLEDYAQLIYLSQGTRFSVDEDIHYIREILSRLKDDEIRNQALLVLRRLVEKHGSGVSPL